MSPVSNLGAAPQRCTILIMLKVKCYIKARRTHNLILVLYCWTRIILIAEAEWVNNDFFSILIYQGQYIYVLKSNDSTVFKMKGSNLENIVFTRSFFCISQRSSLKNITWEMQKKEEVKAMKCQILLFYILTINSE